MTGEPEVQTAAAAPAKEADAPSVGRIVFVTGAESGGVHEHPAIVTGVIDADTINATIFYNASAPGVGKGLKRSEKQWDFVPAPKAAE